MAKSTNFVWNYCNEWSHKSIVNNYKWISDFDLNNLTSGTSKLLGLSARSIQSICKEYVKARNQFKKIKLKWRGKKSLGWIPFQGGKVISKGVFLLNGKMYKFWESRYVGDVKTGSFCQNAKGEWFINLVVDECVKKPEKTGKSVGVDLGLKATATYSNGTSFEGVKAARNNEKVLAMAQRAKKKKRITAIHKKIKNIRNDSLQKETTRLINEFDLIVVGDVSSKKLIKTKMAKSTLDNSWGAYKSMLAYKAIRLGKDMKVVNESWTSKTCHSCGKIADFGGLSGLSVREWACIYCGEIHDRDVNAAKNILRIGHDTLIKGIPLINQGENVKNHGIYNINNGKFSSRRYS